MKEKIKDNYHSILKLNFLIKMAHAVLITAFAFYRTRMGRMFCIEILELFIVSVLIIQLLRANKILGNIAGIVFLLLYDVQVIILAFGNSYVTIMMLSNIGSFKAITGDSSFAKKIILIVVSIIVVLLPVEQPTLPKKVKIKINLSSVLAVSLALELLLTMNIGNAYSPYYAYIDLIKKQKSHRNMQQEASNRENEDRGIFYSEQINDYRPKDSNLPEKPNVILIFVEGFSKNILEDTRNITPNLQALKERSICFVNYYNHTAATYRGISGQLYSGFQLDDYDSNALISLQDILKDEGYTTAFINPEPNNEEFSEYLSDMGFDILYSDTDRKYSGSVEGTMSDREAYGQLCILAESLHQKENPFFLGMYSFGTHVYYDTEDIKFQDGKNMICNRFYNMDYCIGEFVKLFEESGLAEDTVLIITSDHGAYVEAEYGEVFANHYRFHAFCDEIPLLIYYKGIVPEQIDACGLNSLDMAPTVCDFLDISAPNYFLGESLFRPQKEPTGFDTLYFDGVEYIYTKNGNLSYLSEEEYNQMYDELVSYFSISKRY